MSTSNPPKTLSIPITGPLRAFVEQRIKTGGFTTVSEYVRQLIRDDQRRAEQERIETKLLEAVERGDYQEADEAFWQRLRERAGPRGA